MLSTRISEIVKDLEAKQYALMVCNGRVYNEKDPEVKISYEMQAAQFEQEIDRLQAEYALAIEEQKRRAQ